MHIEVKKLDSKISIITENFFRLSKFLPCNEVSLLFSCSAVSADYNSDISDQVYLLLSH